MDLTVLKTSPEQIIYQIKGSDLANIIDKAIKETAAEVEAKLKAAQTPDELLTRQQVADLLGVTLTTLFHWNNKGILPTIKIGSKVRYRRSDIEQTLNKRRGKHEG